MGPAFNPIASDLAERILEIFPVRSRVFTFIVAPSDKAASLTCPQIIILGAHAAILSIIISTAARSHEYPWPEGRLVTSVTSAYLSLYIGDF